jgi:hypothetical protein
MDQINQKDSYQEFCSESSLDLFISHRDTSEPSIQELADHYKVTVDYYLHEFV